MKSSVVTVIYNVLEGLCLLVGLAVPAATSWVFIALTGRVSDFPEYYAAAKLASSGHAPAAYISNEIGQVQHQLFAGMGERIVGFYMPPPALMLIAPLTLFPAGVASYVWIGLLLSSTGLMAFLLKKFWQQTKQEFAIFWIFALLSGPLYEGFRLGQPAALFSLSLTLALFFWRKERNWLAALCLLPFGMKPHFLIMVTAFLAGGRRYRPALYMAVVLLILAIASVVFFGVDSFTSYFASLKTNINSQNDVVAAMSANLNPTLRGQLLRIPRLDPNIIMATGVVFMLVCFGINFFLGKKFEKNESFLELLAVSAIPATIISALHCHDYDLLILAPAVVSMQKLSRSTQYVNGTLIPATLILAALYCLPSFLYFHYTWLLRDSQIINPFFFAMLFFNGSIVYSLFKAKPAQPVGDE